MHRFQQILILVLVFLLTTPMVGCRKKESNGTPARKTTLRLGIATWAGFGTGIVGTEILSLGSLRGPHAVESIKMHTEDENGSRIPYVLSLIHL